MSAITLQFCRFDSTIAKAIEWGTQAGATGPGHVDLVLPPWHPRAGDLLGAQHEPGLGGQPSGYYIRAADYGVTCGMIDRKRVVLQTSDACERAAIDWAWRKIGTPYDTRAIEGIALGEDWSSPNALICSGAAAGLLTQPKPAFLAYPLAKNWRIMTPEELFLICSTCGPVMEC